MDSQLSGKSSSGISPEDSQGKGRGVSWRRQETLALIKFWGEAELKYAVSTLRRNFSIFMDISSAMRGLGFNRSGIECRTKCKLLRRDFKKAVAHNSMSGRAPSTFPYYDEMQSIFRGDAGIMPRRIADSYVATRDELLLDNTENATVTLDLYPAESTPVDDIQNTTPPLDNSQGMLEQSTDDSFLDPAARLSLIRQRKNRTTAVGQIKECISGESAMMAKKIDENIAVNRETKEMLQSYFDKHHESVNRLADVIENCFSKGKSLGLHCRAASAQITNTGKAAVPQKQDSDPLDPFLDLDFLDDSPILDDASLAICHGEENQSDVESNSSCSLLPNPPSQIKSMVSKGNTVQSACYVNEPDVHAESTTADLIGKYVEGGKTKKQVLESTHTPPDLQVKSSVATKTHTQVGKRLTRSEIVNKLMSESPVNNTKISVFNKVLRQKKTEMGNAAVKTDLRKVFDAENGKIDDDPFVIVKKESQQRKKSMSNQRENTAIKRNRKPPSVYSP